MELLKVINDFTECNNFEIKFFKGKIYIYYYDKIEHFSDNKIVISKETKNYMIAGKKLVIETMFKDLVIISGNIQKIFLRKENE